MVRNIYYNLYKYNSMTLIVSHIPKDLAASNWKKTRFLEHFTTLLRFTDTNTPNVLVDVASSII